MNEFLNEIKRRCLFRMKEDSNPRLMTELDWIHDNGGAEALLLMSDFVRYAHCKGAFVGVGMAKECSSLVCYGLGLTSVRPEPWGLPFETFSASFASDPVLEVETSSDAEGFLGEFLSSRNCLFEMSPELPGMAEVSLLEDNIGKCTFHVFSNTDTDLLKEYQARCKRNILLDNLDMKTLEWINENGFSGFSLMAKKPMTSLIQKFHPDCFFLYCLLFAAYGFVPDNPDVLNTLCRRWNGYDIPSTGDPEADRILAESFGVLLFSEQEKALDTIGYNTDNLVSMKPLKSKATAISVVRTALLETEFRMESPDVFERVYGPMYDKKREDRITKIHEVREKLKRSTK